MPEPTRWWWIRHGLVLNPDRRLYGQGDLECHFPDAAAVAALAGALPGNALWLTSHLKRAHQTAEALAAVLRAGGKPVSAPAAHADLAEQHFGAWQGMTFAELTALGRISTVSGARPAPPGRRAAKASPT